MTFPTVKSDPWKKRNQRKQRGPLWSENFWRRLTKTEGACSTERSRVEPPLFEEVIELIERENAA